MIVTKMCKSEFKFDLICVFSVQYSIFFIGFQKEKILF